jgi:hypothetical protein
VGILEDLERYFSISKWLPPPQQAEEGQSLSWARALELLALKGGHAWEENSWIHRALCRVGGGLTGCLPRVSFHFQRDNILKNSLNWVFLPLTITLNIAVCM